MYRSKGKARTFFLQTISGTGNAEEGTPNRGVSKSKVKSHTESGLTTPFFERTTENTEFAEKRTRGNQS
jgi:hypothetical protein